MPNRLFALPALVVACFGAGTLSAQFGFTFDYSLDSAGFFSGENEYRRAHLEEVGDYVSSFISETQMSAISPEGDHSWAPTVWDPADHDSWLDLGNISIAADTVVVYAGGTVFGESEGTYLAFGGPGWGSVPDETNVEWVSSLLYRGNESLMPSIGSITFDFESSFYFDDDISTVESFDGYDFLSVAAHELFHVIGFGAFGSWDALVDAEEGVFLGAASTMENGGNVPLSSDRMHWAQDSESRIFGTAILQDSSMMAPAIGAGERDLVTHLDVAGLKDLGFVVASVPEPALLASLAGLLAFAFAVRRRF